MEKLTNNFTLDELTASQTAARKGLDNTPPPEAVAELLRLCKMILQPLRDAVKRPIVISSGYRSRKVNKEVGGAKYSAHIYGRAADIVIPGESPVLTARRIVEMNLPFDQVILEFDAWTHVSIAADGEPRRQQLIVRYGGGGTIYEERTI